MNNKIVQRTFEMAYHNLGKGKKKFFPQNHEKHFWVGANFQGPLSKGKQKIYFNFGLY